MCRPPRGRSSPGPLAINRVAVTYLFAPAHDERKGVKALASSADAVIFDLEDAVPDARKEEARSVLNRRLQESRAHAGPQRWVRVNDSRTRHFQEDIRSVEWRHAHGAVLPKAEDPDAVAALGGQVSHLLLLVESVAGMAALDRMVGASSRVERVAVGTWDLSLDLGLFSVEDPDDSELMWHVRTQLVLESRRLQLLPPIDGIFANLGDPQGLRNVCGRVARLGYGGKLLIHPDQIAPVQAAFDAAPTALRQARQIVTAYEEAEREGRGAVRVGDRLVDRPMVERARAILKRSQRERR